VVLARNPHYWKDAGGHPQPPIDTLVVRVMPNEDAELLQFSAGGLDVLNRASADAFAGLADRQTARQQLADAGPSLEYNFLFFNLNDPAPGQPPARSRAWFVNEAFRHAVSAAVDRDAIVRLVYRGKGEALWGPVTGANRAWVNTALPREPRSLERARAWLSQGGFTWRHDGTLLDATGTPVEFSLLVAATNLPRMQMATLIQADLSGLGMRVAVTPVEFRAAVDRVLTSKAYDAALFGLVSGDADPNGDINVWLSSGAAHLWRPSGAAPATAWEAEIDDLMRRQVGTRDQAARKRLYDRVQALLAEHEPMIFLASPHVLTAAHADLEGFLPAALPHYTLWNLDALHWRTAAVAAE
jgi:peptide/nickel transport system substrate-binding protein